MIAGIKQVLKDTSQVIEDKSRFLKLKDSSIYELETLSYDIHNLYGKEFSPFNGYYGHSDTLKKYCGLKSNYKIRASIEHAFYFGIDYLPMEVDHNLPGIITQGIIRPEVLRKYTDTPVYPIGTYIQYADDSYYSEKERRKLKDRSGKTLVVFPMHSTHWIDLDYNVEEFIKEIQNISSDYDTVRICMYWKDIIRKGHLKYQEKGYEIVSAGHIYDKNFLRRLKLIISTADMIMSNDVGSYVGQAISLNKPVYLWRQDYSHKGIDDEEYIQRLSDENYLAVFDVFKEYSNTITEEQFELCDKFWGVKKKLMPEELKTLILNLEK